MQERIEELIAQCPSIRGNWSADLDAIVAMLRNKKLNGEITDYNVYPWDWMDEEGAEYSFVAVSWIENGRLNTCVAQRY